MQSENREIELVLRTDYTEDDLKKEIRSRTNVPINNYQIIRKSLDARNKKRIHWNIRVLINNESEDNNQNFLSIPKINSPKKVAIVGSGPAGFFAAYILNKAGFEVTLLERGSEVQQRFKDINDFESSGIINEHSNYAFGEGGAGTFSDGKLTSRTKTISLEKQLVFNTFVECGAPDEIKYLASPHIGSDYLRKVTVNFRNKLRENGCNVIFNTKINNISVSKSKVTSIQSDNVDYLADYFIFAIGHSAYDTYRMLIQNGVKFLVKPFAIGVRVEHKQEIINLAQWGTAFLKGVKAADYKLTFKATNGLSVYSFCMCPGGKIVPASPHNELSIVNGVSNYLRNSEFANSGIVVSTDLNKLLSRNISALEALDWLETLEQKVYAIKNNFSVPGNNIKDFINGKVTDSINKSSYPLGIYPYSHNEIFPKCISDALREGLVNFNSKIKGFNSGIMLGLESKTSSPIQVVRDESANCLGLDNLYMSGEGSGFAGGIVSSAADGIKTALKIIEKELS